MRAYQVIGLLAVCSGVAFVAGMKVQEGRCAATVRPGEAADCGCGPLPASMVQKQEAPAVPTGSGLPCLLVFGTGGCDQCKKAAALLEELGPRLKGKLDVVKLDPDDYRAEAAKWRIKMIPTQILVSAEGEELWRDEGFVPEEEFLTKLREAGVAVAADSTGNPA